MTSLSAVVAAAYHGVSAAMPLDLPPSGQNPIVFGDAADRPLQPHARFLPLPIFQEQDARGQMGTHDLATLQRLVKCAYVFPFVSGFSPHLLSSRLAAAAAAATVVECRRPQAVRL